MPPPVLDDDARRRAILRASEARARRAAIKQDLKAGSTTLAELLAAADRDPVIARMPVGEVLEALPAHGPIKAARLMQQAGIAANRRLGGLGPRQRGTLREHLGARGGWNAEQAR